MTSLEWLLVAGSIVSLAITFRRVELALVLSMTGWFTAMANGGAGPRARRNV